jgi:DNA-directed RNA polymerase specialized sigma24 family protein
MVQEKIILIAKKHDTWVDIVCTFGCTRRIAEDITQEMYIKMQLQLEKGGLDIMYNDEINYYYIFKTLKTLFIDLKRKQKNIQIISLDEHIENFGDTNYGHSDVNFIEAYDRIEEELENMYWYDRKVFEVINSGESIADFSRKSKIKYYALYFTYKKVKNKLKKLL